MRVRKDNKRTGNEKEQESTLKRSKVNNTFILPHQIDLLRDLKFKFSFKYSYDFNQFCANDRLKPVINRQNNTCILDRSDIERWLGKKDGGYFLRCCKFIASAEKSDLFTDVPEAVANLLARVNIPHADRLSIFSDFVRRNRLDDLTNFINLLSPETCNDVALRRLPNGQTVFDNMLRNIYLRNIYVDQIDPCAEAFLAKLNDDTCNQFAISKHLDGLTGLSVISAFCGEAIATTFINRLTNETCNIVALTNDDSRQESNYSYLCRHMSDRPLLQFSSKLSADVLYLVLTKRFNPTNSTDLYLKNSFEILMRRWSQDQLLYFINQQFSNSNHRENLLQHFDLYGISIRDGGESKASWSRITDKLIANSIPIRKLKRSREIRKDIATEQLPATRQTSILSFAEKKGWRYSHLLGRSIIFKNKRGDAMVIKIQKTKQRETITSLANEYKATQYLNDNQDKFGLKSELPAAMEITSLTGVIVWVKANCDNDADKLQYFLGMTETKHAHHAAYIYRVSAANQDYFTYLHDSSLTHEKYKHANHVIVNDLFTLLARGLVYDQLADLYHNLDHQEDRTDKGRYLVFAELLRNMWRGGSGRLTGWKESVEYPNVRGTGLADLGDCVSINEYIGKTKRTRSFFSDSLQKHNVQSGNYLIANIMAEYQYVLFLIAGRRAVSCSEAAEQAGANHEEIFAIWMQHATQVIGNCAQAVSIATHQAFDDVYAKMNSIINAEKLARQMQFWMTTEHIQYVIDEKIPADIYGEDVPVIVRHDLIRANTFNETVGFSINGTTPDLGPVNGQEPIKEANKLFYWMVTMIFQSYQNLSMTMIDIKDIVSEPNVKSSEALRKDAFKYLPKKAYHKLQHTLCEDRLHSEQRLSRTQIRELKQESQMHQREAAALTIQGFWRKYRNQIKPIEKKVKIDLSEIIGQKP